MFPALIFFSLIGLISLYFSMIRESNNLLVILITNLSDLVSVGYGLYLFNLLDFAFQKWALLLIPHQQKSLPQQNIYVFSF